MRGRMNDVKSYVPAFEVGEPMDGGAIGEVVESRAEGFAAGDLVQHMAGWRDETVVPARTVNKLPNLSAPISDCSTPLMRRRAIPSSFRPQRERSARSSSRSQRPGA